MSTHSDLQSGRGADYGRQCYFNGLETVVADLKALPVTKRILGGYKMV